MFLKLMFSSFHGIMEVFVIGILGYIVISGFKQSSSLLDFLTKIVIRISLPCLIFSNMVTNFNPGEIEYWWIFPLLAVAVNIAGALLAGGYVLIDRTVQYRGEFMALVAFQNGIFLPLAFAPVLFGHDSLPLFLNLLFLYNLLSIPTFFTLAVWMMNSTAGIGFRVKDFFSPPIVVTVFSFILVLTGWSTTVPDWILRPVGTLGALTTPLSMLFVGGIIVTNLPKAKPDDWKEPLKITGLKSFLLPFIAALIAFVFRPPQYIALFMIMQSVMPSALLTALIAPDEGINRKTIAGAIMLTYGVSIVTIPLFMGIYGLLYG